MIYFYLLLINLFTAFLYKIFNIKTFQTLNRLFILFRNYIPLIIYFKYLTFIVTKLDGPSLLIFYSFFTFLLIFNEFLYIFILKTLTNYKLKIFLTIYFSLLLITWCPKEILFLVLITFWFKQTFVRDLGSFCIEGHQYVLKMDFGGESTDLLDKSLLPDKHKKPLYGNPKNSLYGIPNKNIKITNMEIKKPKLKSIKLKNIKPSTHILNGFLAKDKVLPYFLATALIGFGFIGYLETHDMRELLIIKSNLIAERSFLMELANAHNYVDKVSQYENPGVLLKTLQLLKINLNSPPSEALDHFKKFHKVIQDLEVVNSKIAELPLIKREILLLFESIKK